MLGWKTSGSFMAEVPDEWPGPYVWTEDVHKAKNTKLSIKQYGDEAIRIIEVTGRSPHRQRIEPNLGPNEAVWSVGDKCTIAYLAFVPLDILLFSSLFPKGHNIDKEFPEFCKWHENLLRRGV